VSSLKGGDELRRRIKAMGLVFKPLGRKWGDRTVQRFRPAVPQRTGATRASFRVGSATARRATVRGSFVAFFIDKGPKAHVITPKAHRFLAFQVNGQPVFARQVHHRGYRGRPFRHRQALEALDDIDMAGLLTEAWNRAA